MAGSRNIIGIKNPAIDKLIERLIYATDRADLVAAINLHVGDLLRSYVAEAIEREIEQWRRDH